MKPNKLNWTTQKRTLADVRLKLADRFILPPFSVLDSKAGVWQDRKNAWKELTGNLAETKENVLFKSASGGDIQYYNNKTVIEKLIGNVGKITQEAPPDTSITKSLNYVTKKTEQQRTTQKKKEFIEIMEQAMGIVKLACESIGISRRTYYRWKDDDPDFRNEVNRIQKQQLGEVEDRLLKAIARDESWAISLYLNRKHPAYRPKQENYIIPTEKTLEDLFDEYKAPVKKEVITITDKTNELPTPGQSSPDRKAIQDTRQEGHSSAVPVQHSPKVLLGKTNETKPDTKSEAKGNK